MLFVAPDLCSEVTLLESNSPKVQPHILAPPWPMFTVWIYHLSQQEVEVPISPLNSRGRSRNWAWNCFAVSKTTDLCDDGRAIFSEAYTQTTKLSPVLTLQDTFKLLPILASDTQKEINLVHPDVETCQKSSSFTDQNWTKSSKYVCMKDSYAELFHTYSQNTQTKLLKNEPPIFLAF